MTSISASSIVPCSRLPSFYPPFSERLSRRIYSSASSWAKVFCTSSTIRTSSWRVRALLIVQCLLKASFALRRIRFSNIKRVTSWANISMPLTNTATVANFDAEELLWWHAILFLTSVVCWRESIGLRGVWEIRGLVSEDGRVVCVRVHNLTSSFEITAWRLKRTKIAL